MLVSGDPEEIAERLIEALRNPASTPARPSFDSTLADIDLLALHGNLVADARGSRGYAIEHPVSAVSILVHGVDSANGRDALARWLAHVHDGGVEVLRNPDSEAATLNRLAASAAHDTLLLCHASVLPGPQALTTMLTAMETTDAAAIVCGYRIAAAGGGYESVAVYGGPPELSPGENVYGARLFLIRKEAFAAAGGFSTDAGMADILEWELLNRMSASGRRVVGVPAPLATSEDPLPPDEPTALQRGQLTAAWTETAPPGLQGFLRMALNRQQQPPADRQRFSGDARDIAGLGLSDLLALRAGTSDHATTLGKSEATAAPDREWDGAANPEPISGPETNNPNGGLWGADSILDTVSPIDGSETWLGGLRIGPDGRLRDRSATYEIHTQSDAADCDFLVADDALDPALMHLLASIFDEAERRVANGLDTTRGNSYLWLGELALIYPEAADRIRAVVARAIALTAGFYDLRAPLRPDLVRLEKLRQGTSIMPRSKMSSMLANGSNGNSFDFRGLGFIDTARDGGALYFASLDMLVEPKPGRLVAATSGPHHDQAVLRVEDGTLLALTFSMRFGDTA